MKNKIVKTFEEYTEKMKNVKINGLDNECINILLTFMNSKLTDGRYIRSIESSGNECNMEWMEDDMDISGDDMIHELFEIYGKEIDDEYTLKIDRYIFKTYKSDADWCDEYKCIKN